MGDLGEEEVMGHVSVGDVVVQGVQTEAEGAVHRLEGGVHELPFLVVIGQCVVVVVLQVGHGNQPP